MASLDMVDNMNILLVEVEDLNYNMAFVSNILTDLPLAVPSDCTEEVDHCCVLIVADTLPWYDIVSEQHFGQPFVVDAFESLHRLRHLQLRLKLFVPFVSVERAVLPPA